MKSDKKTDAFTTHLSPELKEQLKAVAKVRGFSDLSSFSCHLVEQAVEQERATFAALSTVFDDEDKVLKQPTSAMSSQHQQARLMLH